jgi:hypothetical protein
MSCRTSEILDTGAVHKVIMEPSVLVLIVGKDDALWGFGAESQATNALPLVAPLDPGSHALLNVPPATQL